jgi:uncharacterized protein DUF3710
VIFKRRRRGDMDDHPEDSVSTEPELDEPKRELVDEEIEDAAATRPRGPWDREETRADENDDNYLDLGGLVIKTFDQLELQMQVDAATQQIAAVLLAGPESGLELRAFAAPRSHGVWDEVRKAIAGEASRLGGTATEQDGEYGTELVLVMPVPNPAGGTDVQTSRVVGVEGPRWLLRGTFLGRSAEAPDPGGLVETAFRHVIVVRGTEAMAPKEMIPLTLPAGVELPGDTQPPTQ